MVSKPFNLDTFAQTRCQIATQKLVIWIMPEPSLSARSRLFSQKGANCSFCIRSYKNRIILHNICKIENFLPVPFLHFSPPGISIPTAPSRQRSQVPEESLWRAGQFYYCGLCGAGFLESTLFPQLFPVLSQTSCSILLSGLSFPVLGKTPTSLPLNLKKLKLRFWGHFQCPAFCVGKQTSAHFCC